MGIRSLNPQAYYIREKPCDKCGGTSFYKSSKNRCVTCVRSEEKRDLKSITAFLDYQQRHDPATIRRNNYLDDKLWAHFAHLGIKRPDKPTPALPPMTAGDVHRSSL